ncbi:MAG: hypothetical protein M1817_005217 [Caeruleum heppii]|nr:MAG: hypothetical protein M1817_005217 [Caeruleum heppii]
MRNAVPKRSYVYRDRKYNLLAAAQAGELAKEKAFRHSNGKTVFNGVLTYFLVKALDELPLYLPANVTSVSKGTITINRGGASNIAVNNELTLYASTDIVWGIQRRAALHSIQCKVKCVRDLDADATISGRNAAQVQPGHFAVLTKRTKTVVIDVQLSSQIPVSDRTRVRDECLASIHSSLPTDMDFKNSRADADDVVTLKQHLQLRIPSANAQAANNTATAPYDAKELIGHRGFYQLATTPSFQHQGTWTPEYDFSFEQQTLKPDDPFEAIAAYRTRFKNSGNQALYIALYKPNCRPRHRRARPWSTATLF